MDIVKPKVIATGCVAQFVLGDPTVVDHIGPLLTLTGLRILFERSQCDRWVCSARLVSLATRRWRVARVAAYAHEEEFTKRS